MTLDHMIYAQVMSMDEEELREFFEDPNRPKPAETKLFREYCADMIADEQLG